MIKKVLLYYYAQNWLNKCSLNLCAVTGLSTGFFLVSYCIDSKSTITHFGAISVEASLFVGVFLIGCIDIAKKAIARLKAPHQ
jgi:hypothetical protein